MISQAKEAQSGTQWRSVYRSISEPAKGSASDSTKNSLDGSLNKPNRRNRLNKLIDWVTPNDSGLLTDKAIFRACQKGEIRVTPFDQDLIRPAGLSLRLGFEAYGLVSTSPVDTAKQTTYPLLQPKKLDIHGRIRLEPGEVMLAATLERVALSTKISGLLDGTSSYARLGISIVLSHQVTPGFGGRDGSILTLEIVSRLAHAVYLYPGTRICNLMLFRSRHSSERSYAEIPHNYAEDVMVSPSRLAEHLARERTSADYLMTEMD